MSKVWTKDIQNFQINKKIKDYNQYFKDIVLDGMPDKIVNEFVGDIIYITQLSILTISIVFICYKIYPVVIIVQLLMAAHA